MIGKELISLIRKQIIKIEGKRKQNQKKMGKKNKQIAYWGKNTNASQTSQIPHFTHSNRNAF